MFHPNLSEQAQSVIRGYQSLAINGISCSVPYFNNKRTGQRMALPAYIGKGSPAEILEEIDILFTKDQISKETLDSQKLKKFLVDNKIGIDCSGFVYHVLEAESRSRGLTLARKIRFVNRGFLGRIWSLLRPANNCDVATFANDANSFVVPIRTAEAGDFISLITSDQDDEANHILIVTAIERSKELQESVKSVVLRYAHSIAYPEDGLTGTGIKTGIIEIAPTAENLLDGTWTENGISGPDNRLFRRAQNSKTELRRLNWFR